MAPEVINLAESASKLEDYWSPRILAEANGQYIKVAKLRGELVWHQHENEDELFYVIVGNLRIDYEDTSVSLKTGDFHVVPRGTMHNPVADGDCWIALIEPASTRHTGDVVISQTRSLNEQLNDSASE